jgi:hypothetical protein
MAAALRIARLNTRLQLPADSVDEGLEQVWLRDLSQRALPAALGGVAERALSRAGLPPEALVAVRRLDLRLVLAEGADDGALLQAWAQALEQALLQAILAVQPATGSQEDAVMFADAWAAESAHLSQLLRIGQAAWWAERLLDGRGERLDLAPVEILRRWLERQPARTAALLARLAEQPAPGLCFRELLPEPEARALTQTLAERMSQRPEGEFALPEEGTPMRALLATSLERLRAHPQLGSGDGVSAAGLAPWRLALLLHEQPSLALLSPSTLLALAESLTASLLASEPEPAANPEQPRADGSLAADRSDAQEEASSAPSKNQQPADITSVEPIPPVLPSSAAPQARHSAWIHAGGLLLLLNRQDLVGTISGEAAPPGDLALLALQRLLAPLGTGERAAALQRERPLLALLAPDRAWPDRLQEATLQDPAAAERQLQALIAAIPASIRFAPGALRQVYGPRHGASPPLPDRDGHQLAALLWRPGLLVWDGWEISLRWPLASVDGALRREGWDLDPGWQPALRRVVRFHYDAGQQPNPEERP